MKGLKELILASTIAGLTSLSSCYTHQFAKQNKDVYNDAAVFVEEEGFCGPNNTDFTRKTFKAYDDKKEETYILNLINEKDLELIVIKNYQTITPTFEKFIDEESDGLDFKEIVEIFDEGTSFYTEQKKIPSKKDQTNYTETLKKIMRNKNFKNY
jgi:hypothetical protein